MNILEALKKYIRANGGSSRANNIAEAVNDLDSIPQGSGGGGMVVRFELDETTGAVSADKTPSEVLNAMSSGPVVGVLSGSNSDAPMPIGSAFISINTHDQGIGFYCFDGSGDLAIVLIGYVQTGAWMLPQ